MEENDEPGTPQEINLGMQPKDPDVIKQLLQQPSIKSRELGFSTLIQIAATTDPNNPSPELTQLINDGIIELVISQLNPTNGEIIGIICSALRNLAISAYERFEANLDSIPYEFLLSLPSSSEIIDFFSVGAYNSNDFVAHLVPFAPNLASSFASWLQDPNEGISHSALEFLCALALFTVDPRTQPFPLDFQMIKPCLDANNSPRNRALAARILFFIENNPSYIQFILSLLPETDFKDMDPDQLNDVFEVVHDFICDDDEKIRTLFTNESVLTPLYVHARAAAEANFESAVVLLGDIGKLLVKETPKKLDILSFLFSHDNLYMEKADAIFRILDSDPTIHLTPEQLILIARNYVKADSNIHLSCLQEILIKDPATLYQQPIQEILVAGFDSKVRYAYQLFELILDHFTGPEYQLIPPIIQQMHEFFEDHKEDLDPKEQERVIHFFQIYSH